MVTRTACVLQSCGGLSQKLGSVPEAGSTEGLRQEGMSCGPSRTFQYLVETPKEYPPHFGLGVEGDLLQGGPEVLIRKWVSDFLPAGGWDKNHMRLRAEGGEDLQSIT